MKSSTSPSLPATPFGLLLVEGGDERGICQAVAGPAIWSGLKCWYGSGRSAVPALAALAARDPNIRFARSVGVVLDAEQNLVEAQEIAAHALAEFGVTDTPVHGVFTAGSPRLGTFIAPDGVAFGSIESLCRKAVLNSALAACVDALVTCAGAPHTLQARLDKGWLRSYLGMNPDPTLHVHQAFSKPTGINPSHSVFEPLRSFLQAL